MRATYGRSLKAKEVLERLGMEVFVPLVSVKEGVKNVDQERLAVRDLLFVRGRFTDIRVAKKDIPYLQFMMDSCRREPQPMIVSEKQMIAFRLAIDHFQDRLRYTSAEDIDLKAGTLVRIHGGILDGQEARFVKVRGSRAKRICFMLGEALSVTLDALELKFVEILEG